ncbi:MAG: glycosyltransferase family 10 [Chloroflexi bacterium]|nr:glycosyltransferase family 10 [Chloroflexota bacterium]
MDTSTPLPLSAWRGRTFLVMVSRNKRAVPIRLGSAKDMAHAVFQRLRFQAWKISDPWMRARNIYADRIEAVKYFSRYSDFRLYGAGWDQPIAGFGPEYSRAARAAFAGTIDGPYQRKRQVLSRYKFALCFENCAFPGYVTEKIFDCLLAGSIPVYFGAPDVTDFVPAETFIDLRRFSGWSELHDALRRVTEPEASRYLDAARGFLSGAYTNFQHDSFVRDLLHILDVCSQ